MPRTQADVKLLSPSQNSFLFLLPPSSLQKGASAANRNFTGIGVFSMPCFNKVYLKFHKIQSAKSEQTSQKPEHGLLRIFSIITINFIYLL